MTGLLASAAHSTSQAVCGCLASQGAQEPAGGYGHVGSVVGKIEAEVQVFRAGWCSGLYPVCSSLPHTSKIQATSRPLGWGAFHHRSPKEPSDKALVTMPSLGSSAISQLSQTLAFMLEIRDLFKAAGGKLATVTRTCRMLSSSRQVHPGIHLNFISLMGAGWLSGSLAWATASAKWRP